MRTILSYRIAGIDFAINIEKEAIEQNLLNHYNSFRIEGTKEFDFVLDIVNRQERMEGEQILGGDKIRSQIYRVQNGYYKEALGRERRRVLYAIYLNSNYSYGRLKINQHTRTILNEAIMTMFFAAMAKFHVIKIHASSVIKDGKAILFHAPCGTGKSTHSQQWMKAFPDAELLNDDGPVVRVWPDGRVIAYGSPWSGKTPCYKNLSAPVAAFVRINRAKENKIHRLRLVEAYASLLPSCTGVKWNDDIRNYTHETMQKVISTVPFYQLDCLPNEDAARVCATEVLKLHE